MKPLAIVAIALTTLFAPPEPVWQWPVDATPHVVRDFEAPHSEWGPGHRGLDVRAPVGTDVIAPVSGRVFFSGRVATRGVLTIETAAGHLVSMEPVMVVEQPPRRVRAGAVIGEVASGHCPGGCLHIGLRVEGEYRSPARELGILRRARLMPFG